MTQRNYEALFILKHAGMDQEITRSTASLEELIKKVGGSVDGSQSLGRRRLAFRISRQMEGHYHVVRFSAPTGQIAELERLLRLNEMILRFMIVSGDGKDSAGESEQSGSEKVDAGRRRSESSTAER